MSKRANIDPLRLIDLGKASEQEAAELTPMSAALKRMRSAAKLSQEGFAMQIGIRSQSYAKFERGERQPRAPHTLSRIADMAETLQLTEEAELFRRVAQDVTPATFSQTLTEVPPKEDAERPVQIALAGDNLYVLTNRGNIYRRYHGETLLRWFAVHGPWEGPVSWGEEDVADALRHSARGKSGKK